MAVGNLHNGYVYPQMMNTSRAKAVQSGYITKGKQSPTARGTIGAMVKNRAKPPANKTPITKNPITHASFLPRMGNVNKNVGNAPARGFGR